MRNFLIAINIVCASTGAVADDSNCFQDSEAYMRASYGTAYKEDENLVIKQERFGKQIYYVARDLTSGTNHTITLLMERPGTGLCKVLTTYPVAEIAPKEFDKRGYPIVLIAKDQGTTSHEIIYSWNKSQAQFTPSKCYEIRWKQNRMTRKDIACDRLLVQ